MLNVELDYPENQSDHSDSKSPFNSASSPDTGFLWG